MLIPFTLNCMIVGIAVMIHYEVLFQMTSVMPKLKIKHRLRIVFGVFGALIAHVIEIWVFAIAYYLMHSSPSWGYLEGNYKGSLLDAAYFSFTTFTTLGFGDIAPHGILRFLVGIEAVTGLVLITWTASFLYFEMQRYWHDR
ncbi:potassium channel family protein [Ghiorsea bivora]|uniref:potassium channel family protein n=1 Tax=Ghiorsea bivora TaxID=1485545 RepID=UPI00056F7931|nr:potassium channel family protein [Ghiorsea bivora]